MGSSPEKANLVTKIHVRNGVTIPFADWQAQLNSVVAAWPEFASLEILAPSTASQQQWVIIQSFYNAEQMAAWQASGERAALIKALQPMLDESSPSTAITETIGATNQDQTVTEVLVTEVDADKEVAYRKWIAKIHQVEAKFPGFRGVYVQSPRQGQKRNWITLLQFDTLENLDGWLTSAERHKILLESHPLITSLESHRITSPYAGWFASMARGGQQLPAVWKQTMLVLLVLFPLVMLELKFLAPWTAGLNASLATFIGNSISVFLVSWPMMPLAIYFLNWWLSPKGCEKRRTNLLGALLVIALYALEVVVLWRLL